MPIVEFVSETDCPFPTPVRIRTAGRGKTPLILVEQGGSRRFPAQAEGETVVALVSGFSRGTKARFRLDADSSKGAGVSLVEEAPALLGIKLPDGMFATYRYDAGIARPSLHAVKGPGGVPVTRAFPVEDVAEEKEAKDQDHPHHRSFWTAYDEVSGTDNWSEGPNHGWTRHQKFEARFEGRVFGGFTAFSTWLTREQKPLLDERRTVRVYNTGPDVRLVDYDVQLIAAHGDVEYGDTKEGGILAWRVFHSIKEKEGGLMTNNEGLSTEAMLWGKKAAWLDYTGNVRGRVVGVTMMDHPGNPGHPCRWHARSYGLVGANPFATAAFERGAAKTPYHQKKGDTLSFRYRVLIHPGSCKEAKVDQWYHAWIQGPAARVVG